jgi:hypothetical protein
MYVIPLFKRPVTVFPAKAKERDASERASSHLPAFHDLYAPTVNLHKEKGNVSHRDSYSYSYALGYLRALVSRSHQRRELLVATEIPLAYSLVLQFKDLKNNYSRSPEGTQQAPNKATQASCAPAIASRRNQETRVVLSAYSAAGRVGCRVFRQS